MLIEADKLIKHLENRIELYDPLTGYSEGRRDEAKDLLSLVNSMREEPLNDDLEEEIINEVDRYYEYCQKRLSEMSDDDTDISFMDLRHFARHFVNWEKEKMIKAACEWLKCSSYGYLTEKWGEVDINRGELVEDFHKAMEEK